MFRFRPSRRMVLAGLSTFAPIAGLRSARASQSSHDHWRMLAEDVRAQMAWAWRNYVERAFGQDQIKPVSGGAEPFFFPGGPPMGLTIVEALGTLHVMGLDAEFAEGATWIERNLTFDIDGEVQVFETSIRMLGGLLSAWRASGNARLLGLARDLAARLMPAFAMSPTGMPYRFVNLRTGAVRDPVSFPAEIGTYIAEWGTLSRATGDGRFYDVAKRAAKALFDRRSKLDLVADTINVETGEWQSRRATIGPPTDSYFEYLWDGWQLFGDPDFRHWYDVHAAATVRQQAVIADGRLWFAQVDFETGERLDHHQSELAAFFVGLLAQGGDMAHARAYMASWADVQARYGLLPEGFDFAKFAPDRVSNALRPEFADSCLSLFLLDCDDHWRQLAACHYEWMKKTSRAPFGFTVIDDITANPARQGDLCPGYWWSEQMKYYWLLFSNTGRFDYRRNYLSTEGDILLGFRK